MSEKLPPKKKYYTEATKKAVAKYSKKVYDRVEIKLKKGNREILTQIATEQGQSVNSYIKSALTEKIKADTGKEIEL